MPTELPGFYWDQEKNRYFPTSLKPKTPVSVPRQSDSDATVDHSPTGLVRRKRRKPSLWTSTNLLRTTCHTHKRYQAAHDILCLQYANTSHALQSKVPVFGCIKAFASVDLHGQTRRFIGDSRGWLYTSSPPTSLATADRSDMWCADLNLHPESEISSICISGTRCVATCFGPSAKIAVQDLNITGRTSLLSLNDAHDAWSSHLQDAALVLGVKGKALYLSDIDLSGSVQSLETRSDVFSVWQRDNLIYAGCRNGNILRFDKRMDKSGQQLFIDRFRNRPRSSVLHLQALRDTQLLCSHMNGDLVTFDLRFTRRGIPLMQYEGHSNVYNHRLGVTLDPDQEFLFAAGDDRRIRAWSVRTGLPLVPSLSHNENNPFTATFPGVIETMQLTHEQQGLCLWAACKQVLYQFYVGQQ